MDQKTYLIAGASSGIGLQIAKQLITRGCRVIGLNRTPGELADHPAYRFIAHDFLTESTLPEIEEDIEGLAYCPGSISLKGLSQIREADVASDLKLNAIAPLLFVQRYNANLRKALHPSVVLFSSVAATIGLPFHITVSLSKGAVEGLTRALAAELSPHIRVNCIAPSLTDTPLASHLLNTEAKRLSNSERHPLKQIGTAEDTAALAVFLLTEGKWITGQVIGVNGGLGTLLK